MTKENVIKEYNFFKKLAKGDFSEAEFSSKNMTMGDMSAARRDLIISNAKNRVKEMETKTFGSTAPQKLRGQLCFPYLTGKTEKKSDPDILDKIKTNKSKKKNL